MLMINSNLTTVRLIFYYWYTKIARKSQFWYFEYWWFFCHSV
jgi:hypothetical protein